MRFTELFKPKKTLQKKVVGTKFYRGNWIYFVDQNGLPRTGRVSICDTDRRLLGVSNVSGPDYMDKEDYPQIWIDPNTAVRTKEIWCDYSKPANGVFLESRYKHRPYDMMPKRRLLEKPSGVRDVRILMKDFIRTSVNGVEDCWIVQPNELEYGPGVCLHNYFTKSIIAFMTVPVYEYDWEGWSVDDRIMMKDSDRDMGFMYQLKKDSANELKLKDLGYQIFSADDIKEVWERDYASYDPYDADPNHMSKKYDRRNFRFQD